MRCLGKPIVTSAGHGLHGKLTDLMPVLCLYQLPEQMLRQLEKVIAEYEYYVKKAIIAGQTLQMNTVQIISQIFILFNKFRLNT